MTTKLPLLSFQELIVAHEDGKDANLNKIKRESASKYNLGIRFITDAINIFQYAFGIEKIHVFIKRKVYKLIIDSWWNFLQ